MDRGVLLGLMLEGGGAAMSVIWLAGLFEGYDSCVYRVIVCMWCMGEMLMLDSHTVAADDEHVC